jgi:hypothetical protein
LSIGSDNIAGTGVREAAEAIDTGGWSYLRRLYPLFQQAYVELGYPRGYFNDRLVSVMDHLLAAGPKPPIDLSQPKIMFDRDPDLEQLSAGQNARARRIDNELRLKAKLREIRRRRPRGGESVAVSAPPVRRHCHDKRPESETKLNGDIPRFGTVEAAAAYRRRMGGRYISSSC